MIKELFIIWNPLEDQAFYYDTYREFVMAIQKLEDDAFQVWTFEILTYDSMVSCLYQTTKLEKTCVS